MSGAGETNVDGKAHKEGDEVRRRPGKRAEIAGGGEVKTATTRRFQERLRHSRAELRAPPLWWAAEERSCWSPCRGWDGRESQSQAQRWPHGRDAPAGQGAVPRT